MERTVTPNGCHSEGLQLDMFLSLKGNVCISGTNRHHIWHRNMALGMVAANVGPLVLTQPDLSITTVIIIYRHHLLNTYAFAKTHVHTHTLARKEGEPLVPTDIHFSPSITPITNTIFSWRQSEWCRRRSLFYKTYCVTLSSIALKGYTNILGNSLCALVQ